MHYMELNNRNLHGLRGVAGQQTLRRDPFSSPSGLWLIPDSLLQGSTATTATPVHGGLLEV
jgi:hypothetical protein